MKRKAVQRIEEQLMKLQVQATDREENKQIALGTSKLNYLDPRISVAWYLLCTEDILYLRLLAVNYYLIRASFFFLFVCLLFYTMTL